MTLTVGRLLTIFSGWHNMARKLQAFDVRITTGLPRVDSHTVSITEVIDDRKTRTMKAAQNMQAALDENDIRTVRQSLQAVKDHIEDIETLISARDIMQDYYSNRIG
jgi:hypothetical protein